MHRESPARAASSAVTGVRASAHLLVLLGLRQVRMRPGRALLTTLSVVIGVAGVVSVTTATNATHRAYRAMYAAMTGRAAIEVVSQRGGTCPQELVEQIEQLSDVRTAAPVVQRPTSLYYGEFRTDAMVLGVDPARHALVHDFTLESGRGLAEEDGALLDASFARGAGIKLGEQIKIFTRGGMRRLLITGLIAPRSIATAAQGGSVWVRVERAQDLFRLPDRVDALHVMLVEGADQAAVERSITALLPPGVIIRRPEIRSQMVQDRMHAAQIGLNVGCSYALLASSFIILNTFLMNVAERRRQLAILRAIGATRSQITQLLLCEGLLMGLIGTLLGLAAGVAGAWALMRSMSELFMAPLEAVNISPVALVLGSLAGMGISLLATFFPALRAASVPPIEGMRRVPSSGTADASRTMGRVGIVLTILGTLGMVVSLLGWIPPLLVIPIGMLVLVALILIIPAILPPFLRGAGAALRPLSGVEGRIAQGQLDRWRVRTALTVGVVFVALSTGMGMGNTILNSVQDVRDWFEQTLSAHFFVRGVWTDMVSGTASDMPPQTRQQIEAIEGVQLVDALRFLRSTANGHPVLIVVREFGRYEKLPLEVQEGEGSQMAAGLLQGQVVLGTVLAHRVGLHPGDYLELDTDRGTRRLRIAGVVTDYQVGGMLLYMDRQAALRLMDVGGADLFLVRAKEGAVERVEAGLQQLCRREGLLLQSFADLTQLVNGIMGGVEAGLWAILSLEFIVAGFGIANTLTMNVLEQTREIGLLRVIAMTRRQVRRMIFAQAALIGLVALVLGFPGGLLVAWLINVCEHPLTGQAIELTLNYSLFASACVAALLIVLAAAFLPAERAVRLSPAEALAYE